MRPLFLIVCFFCFAQGTALVHAQAVAPTNAPASEKQNAMLSFLTPDQQVQYAKARAKALTDNPDLKAEGEAIAQQGQVAMSSGTAADKQAFIGKMDSHRQKLWDAMLKVDPTLGPVFAAINKHISDIKAKQVSQVQSSGSNDGAAGH